MPLPQSLDIKTLGYLITLLETRSVSSAAEKCGISQPAASRLLARLRDQLQDPLVVRTSSGMSLSPYAQQILVPLKEWLTQGEAVLRPTRFDPATLQRQFRIASTDFGVISVLSNVLPTLTCKAPNLSITIDRLTNNSLDALADGELDAVIIGGDHHKSGVNFHHLFTEHHLGIMRNDHPAAKRVMDLTEFLRWPHIIATIDGFGDPIHSLDHPTLDRKISAKIPSFSAIPYLLSSSESLALLPSRATQIFCKHHNLKQFHPPITTQQFSYFLATHDRSNNDPATQWLVEHIINAMRSSVPALPPPTLSAPHTTIKNAA